MKNENVSNSIDKVSALRVRSVCAVDGVNLFRRSIGFDCQLWGQNRVGLCGGLK